MAEPRRQSTRGCAGDPRHSPHLDPTRLEFQDYRQYAAGDDLRHVDWAAYARSEVLTVRLYREEVSPRIDIVLDASRSMAVTGNKLKAYGEIAALLACAAAANAADTRVITASSSGAERLARPEEIERLLQCDLSLSVFETSVLPLRRLSVRVVISDFLFPHDPDVFVARMARAAASLAIVQLTLPEEADPAAEGGRRLQDVEGHGELDLVIDAKAIQDYRARFNRLRMGLALAARRAGAGFAHIAVGQSLREVARSLSAAGVLEAA
jgi:uncharacterized protein (DUF58 family)